MDKQVMNLLLWLSVASLCFVVSSAEAPPKECAVGTPEYNETLCKETCTKEPHTKEPYCANITQAVATTVQSQQPQQEVRSPVTLPSVTLPPEEGSRMAEVSTPNTKDETEVPSSGVSLQSSLLCSVSSLLLFVYF